jgi:phage terminase small subunit
MGNVMAVSAKATELGLTTKQEAFALAFVETGIATEAYRRAYDVTQEANVSWVHVEACQLLDHPKVAQRVKQLQEEAARMSLYSVRAAFDEYGEAIDLAKTTQNPSAMVAAIKGKVALFGLEAPAKAKVEHTSPDGSMSPKAGIDLTKAPPELLAWIVEQGDATKPE